MGLVKGALRLDEKCCPLPCPSQGCASRAFHVVPLLAAAALHHDPQLGVQV